jgi:hypothetical protein
MLYEVERCFDEKTVIFLVKKLQPRRINFLGDSDSVC